MHKNDSGTTNRILTTTMGSATDLENEGLRRLVVNGVYWGLGLDVPAKADVTYVDEYVPSFYGFDGFRKGLRAVRLRAREESAGGAVDEAGEVRHVFHVRRSTCSVLTCFSCHVLRPAC